MCFNYIKLHSVPVNGDSRQKWIDAIESHQTFDIADRQFGICELHFQSENIDRRKTKNDLKKDALPSIFPFRELYVHTIIMIKNQQL